MKKSKIIALLLCVSLLSACTKTQGGTGIGAVTGALVGSRIGKGGGQFVAMGLGALIGGFAGNRIGASLDEKDKAAMAQTSQKALEFSKSGQAVEWRNPDTGHYGNYTPIKNYTSPEGRYCREFTQTVVIGDQNQKAYGTACRKPDGQWEIISQG